MVSMLFEATQGDLELALPSRLYAMAGDLEGGLGWIKGWSVMGVGMRRQAPSTSRRTGGVVPCVRTCYFQWPHNSRMLVKD